MLKDSFSTIFLNIDGNKTNFDEFVSEYKSMNFGFSAIGLAETNLDPALKELYNISDYTSFYQSPVETKKMVPVLPFI